MSLGVPPSVASDASGRPAVVQPNFSEALSTLDANAAISNLRGSSIQRKAAEASRAMTSASKGRKKKVVANKNELLAALAKKKAAKL